MVLVFIVLFDHIFPQIAGWLVFLLKFLPDMRLLQKLFDLNCEMYAPWLTFHLKILNSFRWHGVEEILIGRLEM